MVDIAFKVVDRKILEKMDLTSRNRHSNKDNPLIAALMQGEIISVENEKPKKFASLYQSARTRNKKMNLRSGKIGETPTIVMWWEDATPNATPQEA